MSPSIILPFSSHTIILSASPSKEIPISALCFFVKILIFFGKVDPHLSFIFSPLGEVPISNTFAPRVLNNFGPDLWAAPFAQSIAIFNPLRLNEEGKRIYNLAEIFSKNEYYDLAVTAYDYIIQNRSYSKLAIKYINIMESILWKEY